MIRDVQNQFAASQALTSDAYLTNVIDLLAAGILGNGEAMAVEVVVEVAADATTGDETYEWQAHTDDNAAMSSATTLITKAVARATLVAGYRFLIPLDLQATERYLGVYFNGGGTTPTITVSAYLVPASAAGKWKAYPDGFNIN